MGFSVSGAAAIIFAAMFITFGMWYTASANSFEQVTEAKESRTDAALATDNTDISITNASYDQSSENLTVKVDNTGTEQLRVGNVDLIVDGDYQTGWQANATVAGKANTDLWLGTEQLTITVSLPTQPERVKVVSGPGIADTAEVEGI